MGNLLNVAPDYQITRTANGVWRRYLFASGLLYTEYTSHATVAGWPLVHFVRGRSPETGVRGTARGIIAVGPKAIGVVAVGQLALGAVAFGQAAAGVVAFGQAAVGVVAVGQLAVGLMAGLGQIAVGIVAVGQIAVGGTGLAQYGLWLKGPFTTGSLLRLFR